MIHVLSHLSTIAGIRGDSTAVSAIDEVAGEILSGATASKGACHSVAALLMSQLCGSKAARQRIVDEADTEWSVQMAEAAHELLELVNR